MCRARTVLEADNGAKRRWHLQKSERPRLTILDLNMPGLSGLELLRQLLEADSAMRACWFFPCMASRSMPPRR